MSGVIPFCQNIMIFMPIPFLQGTALYGAVNRTSFYNGDYEKKYGSLVSKARNDLREATFRPLAAVDAILPPLFADWYVIALPEPLNLGDKDPASGMSETTQVLIGRYEALGLHDLTAVFYPDARHEILNEVNRDEVQADILGWMNDRIG